MTDSSHVTWVQVGTMVLGSGVLSAVLNSWWADAREKKSKVAKSARDAVRIAVILEQYSAGVAAIILENDALLDQYGPHGAYNKFNYDWPELGSLPGDISWTDIDGDLRSRALSIPSEHALIQQKALFEFLYNEHNPLEMKDVVHTLIGYHAYRCLQLARDLRSKNNLPPLDALGQASAVEEILLRQHEAALREAGGSSTDDKAPPLPPPPPLERQFTTSV